ncbi:FixH family protein [Niallia oryzisoli]|uniref:FixH family protein n=1 Tax=Niallia oryzisoli TaxID=1737571 RepID=A0ABZ2CBU8_9BACI
MKKQWMIMILLFVLAGCSSKVESNATQSEGLEVEVISNPENATLLEPVEIIASITHSGTSVGEGTDIFFEIIKKDGPVIGTVTPEKVSDGKYQIKTIFDEEGTYEFISHVTLGPEHVMPVYEMKVSP